MFEDNERLQVWSDSGWSNNLDLASQIDFGGDNHHCDPQIAVDSQGRVYVASIHITDKESEIHIGRVYLSRYDNVSEQVQIWSATGWNPSLDAGIPIDMGSEEASGWQGYSAPLWEGGAWNVRIKGGSNFAYVCYHQAMIMDGETHWHVFLNRASDDGVQIWSDTDSFTGWTDVFSSGTPVDRGTHHDAGHVSIGIDSSDILYISFNQYKGEAMAYGIYLVRYNGDTVEIWDADTSDWNSDLEQGDPLDPMGTESTAALSKLAVDRDNTVYISYVHYLNADIYLNRYQEDKLEIWDVDGLEWTSNFVNGDPVHSGLPVDPPFFTDIYGCQPQDLEARDTLYLTYFQQTADSTQHVYLTRFKPDSSSWLRITNTLYSSTTKNELKRIETTLYNVRDKILENFPVGKKLIRLTYTQGSRVADILNRDSGLKNKTFAVLSDMTQIAAEYFIGKLDSKDIPLTEEMASRLLEVTVCFKKAGFNDADLVSEVINKAKTKTVGELKEIFHLDRVKKSNKK